ncbi:MAG: hypothetical protein FWD35_00475, partial [Oscillospiraceae bacterium]|nr:hypothetical protein [Oscillospiraceae bacterium]
WSKGFKGFKKISEESYSGAFAKEDVLFIAKMHALSRIADSLDYSHKQKAKITLVRLNLEENELVIFLELREDYTLESWTFNQRSNMFRQVFGITPKLVIDNIYD